MSNTLDNTAADQDDELIDVIGLHGDQHHCDDIICNDFSRAEHADKRLLFSYDTVGYIIPREIFFLTSRDDKNIAQSSS